MNCPKCNLYQKDFSPLIVWKGCERCRFGEKEYRLLKHGGYRGISFEEYKISMIKILEEIELYKLIDIDSL